VNIISISEAISSIGFNYFKDGSMSSVAHNDPYVVDINSDGVDELLFAGFESQPNTPTDYDNVSMSLFGWQNGQLANLTDQWLPNGADDIEGSGELVSGDFNGDGLTDIFISGNADMDHRVNAYVLMNQGDYFIKMSLGLTWWQHGADVKDINNDCYDGVFATGYNQSVPRPDLVVLPVPDVDVGLSLSGGVEPRGVQLLLAQGAVKARVMAILRGTAWVDPDGFDANIDELFLQPDNDFL
jgi:hypothetical protein